MKKEILQGIATFIIVAAIFLGIVAVATAEKAGITIAAFTLGSALIGAGASYIKDKKVDVRWTLGWGVVGLVAGLLFGFFGV